MRAGGIHEIGVNLSRVAFRVIDRAEALATKSISSVTSTDKACNNAESEGDHCIELMW